MAAKSNIRKHEAKGRRTGPVQAAIDRGVDVSMLVDNLQRSVTERIRRHQIALNTAEKLRKAKRTVGDDFDSLPERLELTEETCAQFKNLYLDTKEGQLDCLSFIDGLGDFSQAKQESELIEVEETKMYVLSLDALVRTKRAMNRPRDKEAISQLEAIGELRKR